ncbi:MAG: hypothetical protein AAF638_11550, partial [Pseudomonadota bacterium]
VEELREGRIDSAPRRTPRRMTDQRDNVSPVISPNELRRDAAIAREIREQQVAGSNAGRERSLIAPPETFVQTPEGETRGVIEDEKKKRRFWFF